MSTTRQNTDTAKARAGPALDLEINPDDDILRVRITRAELLTREEAATALRYLADQLEHETDHYWNTAIRAGEADRVL